LKPEQVVEQLPMLLDEGHAAVRQLSDSNEAVTTLLQHLQSHLEADLAQVKVSVCVRVRVVHQVVS
jgi:hypothetical protein